MRWTITMFLRGAICAAMCVSLVMHAQSDLIPLQRWYTHEIDRTITRDSAFVHTGYKPICRNDLKGLKVEALLKDSTKIYHPFWHYLYRRHMVELRHDNVRITIDPLLYFAGWKDLSDTSDYADTTRFFQNTRGIKVAGTIGNDFAFETGFYENQAQWPQFMRQQALDMGVAPGMGRWKVYRFEGFDFSLSYAYLHYKFKKYLSLQSGQGKQFIGHGYRSLLLSDAAFNSPFLAAQLESTSQKWRYTTRYMGLQSLERLPLGEVPEALFKRKAMTVHYLSWMPNTRLELGLFEGVIWNRFGSKGHHMPSWGAYVPVLGLHSAVRGLESADNGMLGLNARITVRSDLMFYGQALLDQLGSKGLGWQAGLKVFDLIPRLDLQMEYNHLGAQVYMHPWGLESYSHFNQSLGSPVGPNSDELVGIMEYRIRRIILRSKAQQIKRHEIPGLWYTAEAPTLTPTNSHLIWQVDSQIGLKLNVKYNVELLFNWIWREDQTTSESTQKQVLKSQVLGISLRTNLQNLYNDF